MQTQSIRPFIGAKNYEISRQFYTDFGFKEIIITPNLSLFQTENIAFYLQRAYVKDWINNTMLFLEVTDLKEFWNNLLLLNLDKKYDNVVIKPIQKLDWGKEFFVHDPSGILWHIGEFKN